MSGLEDRLLFVVGARRSGTNWLARILTAHPSVVAMPSETYLFALGIAPLAERFQHANPGSPMPGRTFVDRDTYVTATREFLDRILGPHLERMGADARYLLERTPWHVEHLALIAEVYPDSRVINIVRDGRSVARSLLSMEWGPTTMEEASREWRAAIEGGRDGPAAFGDRYREVRYERLFAEPERQIAELFSWLGLDATGKTWDRIVMEAGSRFNVDPASPNLGVDKWRGQISPKDLRAFELIAGEQLQIAGYTRELPTRGRRGGVRSVRSAGDAVRAALQSMRRRKRFPLRARERDSERRALSELEAHHELVQRFESLVAVGRDDEARALLAPQVQVQISDEDGARQHRGGPGIRDLLDTLGDHRSRGARSLTGSMHSSRGSFTSVGTSVLADGSRWARTLVLGTRDGRISRVALHRFELRREDGDRG